MKTTLIKLQDKFILVSDEEIKEGDFVLTVEEDIIIWVDVGNETSYDKKIIAGIPELPSIDFSLLSEEDCKIIGWVDVEKLVTKYYENFKLQPMEALYPLQGATKRFCTDLFKEAQSLNDKKFSLEDMIKAIDMSQSQYWDIDNRGFSSNTEGDWSFKYTEKQIIQSLQQTSWEVEVNESNQITKIL